MKKYLLLGCGNSRERKLAINGVQKWDGKLVTCDFSDTCGADVVHDLEELPYPFSDDEFDEVHLYEVLEHIGSQGDFRQFFGVFSELWRILKPGGSVCLSVPDWEDGTAYCDPGHRWLMPPSMFSFLSQKIYAEEVGKNSRTDYRWLYKCHFDITYCQLHYCSYYISLRKGNFVAISD